MSRNPQHRWPAIPRAVQTQFTRQTVWGGDISSLMNAVRFYPVASGKTDALLNTQMAIFGNRTIRDVLGGDVTHAAFNALAAYMQDPTKEANKTAFDSVLARVDKAARLLPSTEVKIDHGEPKAEFSQKQVSAVDSELKSCTQRLREEGVGSDRQAAALMDERLQSLGGKTLRELNIFMPAVQAFLLDEFLNAIPLVAAACSQFNAEPAEFARRRAQGAALGASPVRPVPQVAGPTLNRGISMELGEAIIAARKNPPGGKTQAIMRTRFPSLGGKSLNDIFPEDSQARKDIAKRITLQANNHTVGFAELLGDVAAEAVAVEVSGKMEAARKIIGKGKTRSVMYSPIQALGGVETLHNVLRTGDFIAIDKAVLRYVNHKSASSDRDYSDPILAAVKQAVRGEEVTALGHLPVIRPADVLRQPYFPAPPPPQMRGDSPARDVRYGGR